MTEANLDQSIDKMRVMLMGTDDPESLRNMGLALLDLLVDVRTLVLGPTSTATVPAE